MERGLKAVFTVALGMLFLGALVVGPGPVMADSGNHKGSKDDKGSKSGGDSPAQGGFHGEAEGLDELTFLTLEGFVDVPDPSLKLPLPAGTLPVKVMLTFGFPGVQVPVMIFPATKIKGEKGLPASIKLIDGDRVMVDVRVVDNELRAKRLRLEEFPELKLRGLVKAISQDNNQLLLVHLPLVGVLPPAPPTPPVLLTIALGGATVSELTLPVRVTPNTKIEDGPFDLQIGDPVEIKAVVRDFHIVAVKIEREGEEEDDD